MSLIRISESDNWIVDYETDSKTYHVSYFEDGHFVDQCKFGEYRVEDHSIRKALEACDYKVFKNDVNIEDYTFEQIKAAIDDFNRITNDLAKSDKEMYEEHTFEMLTNWHRD
jgi:hypothetical protein